MFLSTAATVISYATSDVRCNIQHMLLQEHNCMYYNALAALYGSVWSVLGSHACKHACGQHADACTLPVTQPMP